MEETIISPEVEEVIETVEETPVEEVTETTEVAPEEITDDVETPADTTE